MKPSLLTSATTLSCCTLFAQNENPYAQFGYQAAIMPEQSQPKMEKQIDRLYIINQDSTDAVAIVALDAINRNITFYDKNRQVLKVDTLTNYTLAHWISPDPYGQFSSPYLSMGNNPVNGVDPDGGLFGLSSRDLALIGFGLGAAGTAIIAKNNGASDLGAFGLAILGGLAVGYGAFQLNNIGHWPTLNLDFSQIGVSTSRNIVSVLISNANAKGHGGRLGGHVEIGLENRVYGFTSSSPNPVKSPKNILGVYRETWDSPGVFTAQPGQSAIGDIRFDLPITDEQADDILEEIKIISLAPPRYGALKDRCTSVAARILNAGKVIGEPSERAVESPHQFRSYMVKNYRKFKGTKVYGSEKKKFGKRKRRQ